jgi:hypothetical protein
MVLGAILVIAVLLILFLVYTVVVLFFTFWYITIPALVLIIVYKKRKSIWKSRGQNRTFLNEQVKREYYNDTSQDSYQTYPSQTLPSQTYVSQSDRLIEPILERLGLSEGEAKTVFGNQWRKKLESIGKRDDKLTLHIFKIQTKIMFDLDYRKEVIHIVDKLIQMIDSVISDNPEIAKKYTSGMDPYSKRIYKHQWKFFKEHKKTTFEEAENELDESEAYEILNLDITATFAQVKRRYRELAKKWHPDKNDSALKTEAERKFVRINQAYETIERKKLVA